MNCERNVPSTSLHWSRWTTKTRFHCLLPSVILARCLKRSRNDTISRIICVAPLRDYPPSIALLSSCVMLVNRVLPRLVRRSVCPKLRQKHTSNARNHYCARHSCQRSKQLLSTRTCAVRLI